MKFYSKNTKDIELSVSKVTEFCKKNNLDFTAIRKKVFEIILKYKKPIKAYKILEDLGGIDEKISHPPTVYRAIDFLINNGFVHKLNSINSYVGCFHPNIHKECYFLICKKCNIYKECCNADLTNKIFKTAEQNNFTVSNTTLEIVGHCLDCAE